MSKFFLDRHSIIRAPMKYKSSRNERTEAPRTSPSQPPILAEKDRAELDVFTRY